jgi:hypothetical protein
MNVTINILELASELAQADLELHMSYGAMYKDDGSVMTYTDEAQDEFNELYDKYYTIIESCTITLT